MLQIQISGWAVIQSPILLTTITLDRLRKAATIYEPFFILNLNVTCLFVLKCVTLCQNKNYGKVKLSYFRGCRQQS